MSDQAKAYRDNLNGLAQQQIGSGGMQQSALNNMRLAKVWVAYTANDEMPTVLAVFPTKALADIFIAGANAAKTDAVMLIERAINYGG